MTIDAEPHPKLTRDQVRQHYAEGKSKMVKKLLYLGYQMGYNKPTNNAEQNMSPSRVNKIHVNRWLLSEKSRVRKEMDDMTHKELVQVLTQFEMVYKDFLKRF